MSGCFLSYKCSKSNVTQGKTLDHFNSTKSISLAPTPMSHWKNLPQGETQTAPWRSLSTASRGPGFSPPQSQPQGPHCGQNPLRSLPVTCLQSSLTLTGPGSRHDAAGSTSEVWSHLPLVQALPSCQCHQHGQRQAHCLCWCCCHIAGATHCPSQHLGELAQLPPCSQWVASMGARSLCLCLLQPPDEGQTE